MANTHFQSNNGVVIINNTAISTPTNILIKGTNTTPERKNLFSRDLFEGNSLIVIGSNFGSSGSFWQRYGSTIIFSNKGSNERSYIKIEHLNPQAWLNPSTANQPYTITFRINKVENLKDSVNLAIINGTANMSITSSTNGIFSVVGNISQSHFNSNWTGLLAIDINTNNILEPNKEVLIEIELISFELGNHINDPLLYMPETPFEISMINSVKETPLISSNALTILGEYRLEGEVALFLEELEKSIIENYDLYKPSKRELNMINTILRRQ